MFALFCFTPQSYKKARQPRHKSIENVEKSHNPPDFGEIFRSQLRTLCQYGPGVGSRRENQHRHGYDALPFAEPDPRPCTTSKATLPPLLVQVIKCEKRIPQTNA